MSTLLTHAADIPFMGLLNTSRMRELRESLDLSQEEAARRAGVKGRARWSNIESGKRDNITLKMLERIAAALECEPADLLVRPRTRGPGR